MFTKKSSPKEKSAAQAMIEFALVLPILLLVVYGLLEAGRLLFIFASVNTASRQAVRYGSAIGLVDTDNDSVIDTPRFEDCTGITAAANNVAFITSYSNVNITYDRGLDSSGNVVAISGINPDPTAASTCTSLPADTIENGDRINVYVSAQFSPIVPFVPLDPLTIESSASRTIVGEISIAVTALPQGWPGAGGSGTPALVTSLDPGFSFIYDEPGDIVYFLYTMTNIEPDDLLGPYTITEYNIAGVTTDCSGADNLLETGESTTCTGTYTVTQADIDAGSIESLAVATTALATSNEYNLEVFMTQNIDMDLQKVGSPSVALNNNDEVDFTYTITNTGNVTLTGPFEVTDDKIASVDCSSTTDPLTPGSATVCSGEYNITAGDISAGSVTNFAAATSNEAVSNLASFTVVTQALTLNVTANPTTASTVGELITFTYTFTNVGTENLQSPYNVTASHLGTITSACSTSPIPPGGSIQCQSQYSVTQADIDAGAIVNVASGTAKLDGNIITSPDTSATVLLTQNPDLALSISTNPASPVTVANTLITYTYTLQNNGNVSLYDFSIVDDLYGNITCTGATSPLAPGASTTCSPASAVTYTISATDLLNGSIINKATATAKVGTGITTTNSSEASLTFITYNAPRITLELTANPTSASKDQVVAFTFLVRNTGNTDFTGFTLTPTLDPGLVFSSPCLSNPIPIGGSATCSANYTVTAADEFVGTVTTTWEASAPEATLPSSDTAIVNTFVCSVSISNIQKSGDTMYATITSNSTLTVSSISATWNNDRGHQTGGDKTARLIEVSIDSPSSSFTVSPSNGGPTYTTPGSYAPTIQNGSRVIFTFHQSYDNQESTDRINVTFVNPSCASLTATP